MPSSDSDGQPPPRKRSRAIANDGEDAGVGGKKARGRPRVETQDTTAVERRRTQIRHAQRAYRQRKETTISSLQDKNARLQSIIEQMNKTFLRFNDTALKSGLVQYNSSLAQQLRHVTENFVVLAKTASEGNADGDDEVTEIATDTATETQDTSARDRQSHNQGSHVGWGYSATYEEPPHQEETSESSSSKGSGWHSDILAPAPNYAFNRPNSTSLVKSKSPVSLGHLLDQGVSSAELKDDDGFSSQQLPFGLVDISSRGQYSPLGAHHSQVFSVNVPTPDVTPPTTRLPTPPLLASLVLKHLNPARTYSHDETSFARRLTRASLESGFFLLSNAKERSVAIHHIFRLSIPYTNLNKLRDRFKMILARGTDEELDYWDTPFIHLGGAGTHYPRKDAQGNVVAIPNSWRLRQIGPMPSRRVRAENTVDPSQSHDVNIDLTGLDGEWFDAHDVEGYLEQELGCRINPRVSFAEVLVDEEEHFATDELPEHLHANRNSQATHPQPRRPSGVPSETPSFSRGSSSADATSASMTPTHNVNAGNMDNAFAHSDVPYGLDMGVNLNNNFPITDFGKYPDVDPSTFFDQPLGLDLAPGFDLNLNPNSSSLPQFHFDVEGGVDLGALGLDLMSGNAGSSLGANQIPVVRQKKKKRLAWVDVSKLVDEIIKRGICLGRAPGFRREDVDMAFRASIITAC